MIVSKGCIRNIDYVTGPCPDCGEIVAINDDGTTIKWHKCKGNYIINYIACYLVRGLNRVSSSGATHPPPPPSRITHRAVKQ